MTSGPRIQAGDTIPNGWFWDGEQQVFHDGTGNFYIGQQWYARPDLLAAQPFPAPPTMADKARMEKQRLSTPWPTYGAAWRHAKKEHWLSRYYAVFGLPISWYGGFGFAIWQGIDEEGGAFHVPFFGMLAIFALYPFSFWWIYYKHMRSVDKHKAFAFLAASYGVTAVGVKVANHTGRLTPESIAFQEDRFREQVANIGRLNR